MLHLLAWKLLSVKKKDYTIPEVAAEHDKNIINELNQRLPEKWGHVEPLYDFLILVLPALTWSIDESFIMLNIWKTKKFLIPFLISKKYLRFPSSI